MGLLRFTLAIGSALTMMEAVQQLNYSHTDYDYILSLDAQEVLVKLLKRLPPSL